MKGKTIRSTAMWLLSLACLLCAFTQSALASDARATREYAVSAIVRAAGLSGGTDQLNAYADGGSVSAQYASAMAAAVANGVITGYADNTLRPQAPVSRAEAMVIASRCIPEMDEEDDTVYLDGVPGWAGAEVCRLTRVLLLDGENGDAFAAGELMTTAQIDALADKVGDYALLSRIRAANSYDALMSRHSSVSLSGTESTERGFVKNTRYYSPEFLDVQTEGSGALLAGNKLIEREDESAQLVLNAYLDGSQLESIRASHLAMLNRAVFPEDENTVTEEDGVLRIESRSSSDNDETYEIFHIEQREGDEHISRLVCDADDLDVREFSFAVRRTDGTELVYQRYAFAYDVPYDKEGSLFAEYFNAEKLRRVTLTYAPGTPMELSESYDLPKSVAFRTILPLGEEAAYFTDAACTQPYTGSAADDYSALHLYIPTCLHEVTAEEETSLFERVSARTTAETAAEFGACASLLRVFYDGAEAYTMESYLDKNVTVDKAKDTATLFTQDAILRLTPDDACVVVTTPSWRSGYIKEKGSYIPKLYEGEKITSAGTANGVLYIVSEISDPQKMDSVLKAYEHELGHEIAFPEGTVLRWLAALDEETNLRVLNRLYLCEPDGTFRLLSEETFSYETRTLEELGFGAYLALDKLPPRGTLNVVWGVGGAEETASYHIPAAFRIWITASASYTDPDCKTPLIGTWDGSRTIYIKAEDIKY